MSLNEPIPGAPAIEAVDVVKRYQGVRVLDGISLSVDRGEFIALVGESGAGKTTLLKTFNRIVDPDEGAVRLGGRDASGMNPVRLRREMGYVQQEGGLLPHWTVLHNVGLVPWLKKRKDTDGLARAALKRVGLPPSEFGDRLPAELSGGQRQRVALARALAGDPDVVLLDEPFRALDAITRWELVNTVRAVLKEVGVTVVIVTHDLRSALRMSDRIAVLRAGRIEQISDPSTLRNAPENDYVGDLIHRSGADA